MSLRRFIPTNGAIIIGSMAIILMASTYYHLGMGNHKNSLQFEKVSVPDFAAISDVNQKKSEFFAFIKPYIEKKNAFVQQQRQTLVTLQSELVNGQVLSEAEQNTLTQIASQYRIEVKEFSLNEVDALLVHVDVIPEQLVLIQAANESGWGTSRFAKEANNFFGQWCFTQGCGVVPNQRKEGMTHEVAKFDSVGDSVSAYVDNLNTNQAYSSFRELRANIRAQHKTPTAEQLIHGLGSYSERSDDYIHDILTMLRHNKALLEQVPPAN
ncbi:glucosaminidase domain-containing protein [Vibrio breoganii]|uniref:glucosaminidase domain-containing protein n=1 Tax=Vibrio breoganii TaxID=553239 RepID=UPI00030CCC15|nr:glucosaminidase domain-containing protein [Vibrio breoganii]OED95834.1 glucosaminidase [Vibrio breoganii ZF-55]PMO59073.1 glucosaminidase [Vibrio breoganii]